MYSRLVYLLVKCPVSRQENYRVRNSWWSRCAVVSCVSEVAKTEAYLSVTLRSGAVMMMGGMGKGKDRIGWRTGASLQAEEAVRD